MRWGIFFLLERLIENIPILLRYLPVTFEIVLIATTAGVVLAIFLAAARIYQIPVAKWISRIFVSFILGTPILVQMFIIYYGLPLVLWNVFGIDINGWDKLIFVLITYALNQSAFLAEIFRSAILSVPVGQTEAGYSVGLTGVQTFMRIVLPQAFRVAIPSFSVNLVGLFQDTSLAFMIGIIDIMGKAKLLQTSTQHVLECYIIIAVVFVCISVAIRLVFRALDQKLQYGR